MKKPHRPVHPFVSKLVSGQFRLFLMVLAALSALLAWLTDDYRFESPQASAVEFNAIRLGMESADGDIVLLDDGERRLLGLDSAGRLRFMRRGGRDGDFFSARPLGFDSLGRFYLDDTVTDLDSSNTARRQILRFDRTGRSLGPVLRFDFEGDAMSDWEAHPVYAQLVGDTLYWFMKNAAGAWELLSAPALADQPDQAGQADSGGGAATRTALDFDAYDCVDIAVRSAGELFILGYDGSIQRWTAATGLADWYRNDSPSRIRFPDQLAVDARQRLLVLDGKRTVYRFDPVDDPPSPMVVLSPDSLAGSGLAGPLACQDLGPRPGGGLIVGNQYGDELVRLAPDGSAIAVASTELSPWLQGLHLAAWLAVYAALLCLASAVFLSYLRLLASRTPLVVKQLLVFLPLIAVMVFAVGAYIFNGLNTILDSQLKDRLLHIAHLGAAKLGSGDVEALDYVGLGLQELLVSEPYLATVAVTDAVVNRNEDPWDSQIFPYVYKKQDGVWWIAGSFDYAELYPYFKPEFEAVLAEGSAQYFRYSDVYGSWLSALAPVRDEAGEVVAVFEASMSAESLDEARRGYILNSVLGGAAILGLFLLAFSVFTAFLLRSVRKLREGAARVAVGDFDVQIDIRSRDEIEELGTAFNAMSSEIKGHVDNLNKLNRANERFVPREFLQKLGYTSITEVGLGDQVLTDMGVLFSDIRDFTTITESLGPAGTMDFLNTYLAVVGPAVRAAGGFIDKYIGDAVMALFPGGADDALAGAVGLSRAMDEFRATVGLIDGKELSAGIGLNIGQLMLGVIGEAQRFDGTVIADAVNLASRIESLTKLYGVRILASGAIKQRMRQPHQLRFLDLVRVKGKHKAVRLYEVLRKDDADYGSKTAAAKSYIAGFELYRGGRFDEAALSFESALAVCPTDRPAALLLQRCGDYSRQGAPQGWRGITEFHEK
ncbi:MAG: hypothetical protein A2087_09860 [Spirochaetes bacterium GWD1_61_31]|nr:MAG: hypothetical protein A2Y37_07425 [Spirochaetes bacterium GWB1_60_80]OHD34966.1 MAG: hypothetical protein A2087_09860 [Spirochaetes bacterium GWD1_61_31]OHD42422.1 MAG: hypothetical protein A2Y35_06210 [Spirochaetes bacterium GWE1_60_18]HAP43074.1 hypothetical protein [Spirochaetaceae bacterium]HBO40081.1 hypothetical protein [Spirochaetaceae bacterium]